MDLPHPGFNARLTHPAVYGKMETNGSQSRQIWKSIKANRKEGSVILIKAISRIVIIMENPTPSLAPFDAPLLKLSVPFWYPYYKGPIKTIQGLPKKSPPLRDYNHCAPMIMYLGLPYH